MIKVGLLGSTGRMGKWVKEILTNEFSSKAVLSAQASSKDSLIPLAQADVIIDFSSPQSVLRLISSTPSLPPLIVGSTGWTLDQRKELEGLAKKTPVLMSSNFSTGVMALSCVLREASPILEKLGYRPVIVETHHQNKKDAPSGTALSLQRVLSPDGPDNVSIHSVRGGEIIGDHEVTFYGKADHITIGHFAQDRSIFARGAIDAALWLCTVKNSGKILSVEDYFREKLK